MRIKICILFSFCVCLFLCLTVSTHPGGTDSNGGHTNHSTGEYHYHHGYSAHAHYDMDGDSVVDCPYDFRDNVDHTRENDSSKTLQSTSNTMVQNSIAHEGKAPIASLVIASAIALALVVMPRYLLRDGSADTSIITKSLSFICSILPQSIVLLIIYLVKGDIRWAILSSNEIIESFVFAAGLSFAVATILWLLSFAIASGFEKIFHIKDIFPSYIDSYAFSFALILFIRLIQ